MAMNTTDQRLEFPFPANGQGGPPAQYGLLRSASPLAKVYLPDQQPVWLMTRYRDVVAVLADKRFSRAAAARLSGVGFGRSGDIGVWKTLINMDPPDHARLKGIFAHRFTSAMSERRREAIRSIANELLSGVAAGQRRFDLISEYAIPFAERAITSVVGIPWASWRPLASTISVAMSRSESPTSMKESRDRIDAVIAEILDVKKGNLADDIASDIAMSMVQERVSLEEARATIFALCAAGQEGTANTIGRVVAELLLDDKLLADLLSDVHLLPSIVDEVIRTYSSSNESVLRVATEDVELSGGRIARGDAIIAPMVAAGRDPEAFEQADSINPWRRQRSQGNIGFGYGVHYCVGAPLARVEIETAIQALFRKFPKLKLASDRESIRFDTNKLILRMVQLNLTW